MNQLTLLAARRHRSPRTGFVHHPLDVVPLYENGCFATALLKQSQVALVLEGKELLLRLLAFQAPEGNFPVYLHDFPRCYDPHMGLRLGALWMQILQSTTMSEVRQALQASLAKILDFTEKRRAIKPLSPLWEFRYQILRDPKTANSTLDTTLFSAEEWWEYWVGLQLIEKPVCSFYNPTLGLLVPELAGEWAQEGFEPAPHPVEWHLGGRPTVEHVRQLRLSALSELIAIPSSKDVVLNKDDLVRMAWKGDSLHTLLVPKAGVESRATQTGSEIAVEVQLGPLPEMSREDLFEFSLFCDVSPETAILVEGRKATVFGLNETVSVATPEKTIRLRFEKGEGDGEFCGHLFRANRPSQLLQDNQAYDWKIGLRTLRRTTETTLRLILSSE